jgi:hypothetical protein
VPEQQSRPFEQAWPAPMQQMAPTDGSAVQEPLQHWGCAFDVQAAPSDRQQLPVIWPGATAQLPEQQSPLDVHDDAVGAHIDGVVVAWWHTPRPVVASIAHEPKQHWLSDVQVERSGMQHAPPVLQARPLQQGVAPMAPHAAATPPQVAPLAWQARVPPIPITHAPEQQSPLVAHAAPSAVQAGAGGPASSPWKSTPTVARPLGRRTSGTLTELVLVTDAVTGPPTHAGTDAIISEAHGVLKASPEKLTWPVGSPVTVSVDGWPGMTPNALCIVREPVAVMRRQATLAGTCVRAMVT